MKLKVLKLCIERKWAGDSGAVNRCWRKQGHGENRGYERDRHKQSRVDNPPTDQTASDSLKAVDNSGQPLCLTARHPDEPPAFSGNVWYAHPTAFHWRWSGFSFHRCPVMMLIIWRSSIPPVDCLLFRCQTPTSALVCKSQVYWIFFSLVLTSWAQKWNWNPCTLAAAVVTPGGENKVIAADKVEPGGTSGAQELAPCSYVCQCSLAVAK